MNWYFCNLVIVIDHLTQPHYRLWLEIRATNVNWREKLNWPRFLCPGMWLGSDWILEAWQELPLTKFRTLQKPGLFNFQHIFSGYLMWLKPIIMWQPMKDQKTHELQMNMAINSWESSHDEELTHSMHKMAIKGGISWPFHRLSCPFKYPPKAFKRRLLALFYDDLQFDNSNYIQKTTPFLP